MQLANVLPFADTVAFDGRPGLTVTHLTVLGRTLTEAIVKTILDVLLPIKADYSSSELARSLTYSP